MGKRKNKCLNHNNRYLIFTILFGFREILTLVSI